MTAGLHRHVPLDGALVRLAVEGPRWAERLPRVPAGFDVSVSFSTPEAAARHGAALAARGYRRAGVCRDERGGAGAYADVLVRQRLLDDHPGWWRALSRQADRTFSLALGPVQARLAEVLRVHAPRR